MKAPALTSDELRLMRAVFRRHPEITSAILFGPRAKGTQTDRSDIDLAVTGSIAPLRAETIAAELDDLPLPYRFEVQPWAHIRHQPLRDHIERVGVLIYPEALGSEIQA